MAFLTINGIRVLVKDLQVTRKLSKEGTRARGFRGQLRDMRRGIRRIWECQAVIQDYADAEAFRRMINGEGHMVDYADGRQASTNLNPMPGGGNVKLRPAVIGAWGRGCLQINSTAVASDGLVDAYDIQCRENDWTVLVWVNNAAGAWIGSAIRADGTAYRNGVLTATALKRPGPPEGIYVRQIDGLIEIRRDASSAPNVHIDDLVLLPYSMSTAQMAAVTASASKFGPCPLLMITGDMVGKDVLCRGKVLSIDVVQKPFTVSGFGWIQNAKVIKFQLMEYDPAFLPGSLSANLFTGKIPGAPAWWFDSNDVNGILNEGLVDGSTISTWIDKGSRAQNATQATPGFRPVFHPVSQAGKLKYLPGVQFDGADDFLFTAAGTSLAGTITMAAIVRTNTVAAGTRVAAQTRATTKGFTNVAATWNVQAGSLVAHPLEPATANEYSILIAVFRGDGIDTDFPVNGVNSNVNAGAVLAPTGITLGATVAGANPFNGSLIEVAAWNDSSYGTFDAIIDYARRKYGEFPQ